MRDLFTMLIAKFVEENCSPQRAPKDSDEATQWMESLLNPDAEMREEIAGGQERHALLSYLELSDSELQSLPPDVQNWFLERWAMTGPSSEDEKELSRQADRIARAYLAAGPGTYQFACVRALLAFDERSRGPSHVSRIWDFILRGDDPEQDLHEALLIPLLDALLDLTQLDGEGVAARRALRQLVDRDRDRGYLRDRLAERAEIFGDPYRRELLALLYPGSERSS